MEINTQTSSLQSVASTESTLQQPVNEQEEVANETDLSTESTVTLSSEAQSLSSSAEASSADNESTINTEEDAQAALQQFQQDAANDPTLTQEAQSSNLTSDVVSQLIG